VLAVLGVHRIGRKVSTRTTLSRRSAVIVSKSLRIACFLDGRCLKDGGLLRAYHIRAGYTTANVRMNEGLKTRQNPGLA
jgi:hypothetical protein